MMKKIFVLGLLCMQQLIAQNAGIEHLTIAPFQSYATIEWKTNAESKNSFFTIEKSKDGIKFSKILDVPVSADNTGFKEYIETDYQPYKHLAYYRIKTTDANGNASYFPNVNGLAFDHSKINDVSRAPESIPQGKEIIVVLQDSEGTEYSTKLIVTRKNSDFFADDTNKIVPPGIYTVISASDENIYGQKVIVK